jgi:3-oxoacyl-[acyl-carrier protein] reductase
VDLGIAGKIAISGGGSKGMGRAISIDLSREGCRVVVAARGKAAVDEVVAAIEFEGGQAVPAYVDMARKDGIQQAVAIAKQTWGDPDIAVGNVYGPQHGRWEETTDEDFRAAFERTW